MTELERLPTSLMLQDEGTPVLEPHEVKFVQSLLDRYSENGGLIDICADHEGFMTIVRKHYVARPATDHAGLKSLIATFAPATQQKWEAIHEALKDAGYTIAALSTPSPLLVEVKEALQDLTDQLWHLAKDPENNPFVKQGKDALAKLEQAGGD